MATAPVYWHAGRQQNAGRTSPRGFERQHLRALSFNCRALNHTSHLALGSLSQPPLLLTCCQNKFDLQVRESKADILILDHFSERNFHLRV